MPVEPFRSTLEDAGKNASGRHRLARALELLAAGNDRLEVSDFFCVLRDQKGLARLIARLVRASARIRRRIRWVRQQLHGWLHSPLARWFTVRQEPPRLALVFSNRPSCRPDCQSMDLVPGQKKILRPYGGATRG
jgi:hypothetical protein